MNGNREHSDSDKEYDEEEYEEVDELEEDNEELSDESELTNEGNAKKKKLNRPISKYVAEEAEVDEEDEEEDELSDEVEEGIVEDLSSLGEAENGTKAKLYSKLQLDSEEAMRELADKYMRREKEENEFLEQSQGIDPEIIKQAIIPTANEPMIWMVHCKIGKEREVIKELMARYLVEMNTPLKPLVFSAIIHDHIPGIMYVEAQRESHVTAAISGLAFVLKKPLKLIPREEMPSLLKVPKVHQIQEGDWVRIKSYVTRGDGGLYKRDLAKVHSLINDSGKPSAIVLLVPRLNVAEWSKDQDENYYDKVPNPYENDSSGVGVGSEKKRKRKFTVRYPQKVFNSALVNSINPNSVEKVEEMGEVLEVWNDMTFLNGYLYVQINISNLIIDDVNPTPDELLMFQGCQGDGISDIKNAIEKRKVKLMKGDVVRVTKGELTSVIGVIFSTDGENAFIMPQNKQLSTVPLSVPLMYLCKYFKNGDRIKVIFGAYTDETGLITNVSDEKVTFITDSTQKEIEVNVSDIQETAEINSGKVQLGSYGLCDLIQFEGNYTGVIVKVNAGSVEVIDSNNHMQLVQLHEIIRKRRVNNASLQLSNGKVLYVGDMARVTSESNSSILGNIIHIYGDRAWLQCREVKSNIGIVCASRFNLETISARNSPSLQHKAFQSFGIRRQDNLLKAPVYILDGQWKGYKGTVKFVSDDSHSGISTARVELDIGSRIVTVRVDKLKDLRSHTMQYDNTSYQSNMINQFSNFNFNFAERTPARLDTSHTAAGERDVWSQYISDILPIEPKLQVPIPQTPGVSASASISDSFLKGSRGNNVPFTPVSGNQSFIPIPPTPGGQLIPPTPGAGHLYGGPIVPQTPNDYFAIPATPDNNPGNFSLLGSGNGSNSIHASHTLSNTFSNQQNLLKVPPTPGGPMSLENEESGAMQPSAVKDNDSNSWFTKNVEVKIKSPGPYQDRIGYISDIISEDQCIVTILSSEGGGEPTKVRLSKSELDWEVVLDRKDFVLILTGPYKGEIGSFLGMDVCMDDSKRTDCIVKFFMGTSVPDNIAIIPVDHLAKIHPEGNDFPMKK